MEKRTEEYILLLVDDEQAWAKNTAQYLTKECTGLKVEVASNGKEAMEKALALKPDFFFLDLLLPDIHGLKLTQSIRNRPEFTNSSIVLLTILQTDEPLMHEALAAGADLFIQKPLDTAGLKEVATKCMELAKAQRLLAHKQNELDNLQWSLRPRMQPGANVLRPNLLQTQRAQRSQQIFAHAPDAIAITTSDALILEVNAKLCEYSGYQANELIGNQFSVLFSEAELKRKPFQVEKVLKGETVENERFLRQRSGLEIPVWMKSLLLPDGTVVSFMRDISSIRKTEQELTRQKAFSQNITEKIPNIVYLHDLRSRSNVYCNRSVAAMLGYPPDVLTDEDEGFLEKVVHPDDYKMFDKFYEQADLSDPELTFHFEYRMKAFSGEWRWFKGYERVWEHKDGKITMLIGAVLDVSSEKEKEEALRMSEQRYRKLMELFRKVSDNMPDMLWAKDMQKRFIFVNKSICDNLLHATDQEEPIGKTDLFFANRIKAERPDDPDYHTFGKICQDSDEVIFQTQTPGRFDEFGNVRGKFLYLDVVKAPILDEQGKLIGVVGAARDITERKLQEKYLAIQHAVAEAVVSSADLTQLVSTIRDELKAVIDTSSFYVAMADKNRGKLFTPFVEDIDEIDEWDIEGSLTGLVVQRNEVLHIDCAAYQEMVAQGEVQLVGTMSASWLGVPLTVNGEAIGAIVVQSYTDEHAFGERDQTLLEFLANQIVLYIQRKSAIDQAKLLERAVEQSPNGVAVLNAKRQVVYINQGFADLLGRTKENIIACGPGFAQEILKNDELVNELMESLLSENSWKREIQVLRPDGSSVWVDASIWPIYSGNNELSHFLVNLEDVSAKREMLNELIEARDRAEESDRLKSAFLMNMSHEIRTPLNSIMGFSDLLATQTTDPEDVRAQAEMIYRNGQRLLGLINNILKISKIDAGAEELQSVVFSPAELLQEVVHSFQPQANKQGISLKLNVAESDRHIRIASDRMKIHQVLDNLVNNALKFTHQGFIELGFKMTEGKAGFYVRDTGRGIAETEVEKIFERFYQADVSLNRGYEGVGLGLALCKSIMNLLGGKIWATSEPGKGSVFHFELPVERHYSAHPETGTPSQQSAEVHVRGNEDTILVVDDDEASLIMMKALCRSLGQKALFAPGGAEAIEVLRANPGIGLIFMDIKMPGVDGIQALEEIRKAGNNCVIVATTAYALHGDEQRLRAAGFDDYLAKPVTKASITQMIMKYRK
ncbi:MAG: PAS domain S-box protein [Bacteroidetes bacterium]|nr:PAS domain S-box protein [Bacteroidota bacterium]